MSKKLKIVLIIFLGLFISLIYYRMFFSNFDKNNIVEYNVVLIQKPEYHNGARSSPTWWLKSKHLTFEIEHYNPLKISKQEIQKLKKGDSLKIYNYDYISVPSLGNNRIIIHGLKTSKLNKYYPQLIKKKIRDLDVQVFWSIHFLAVLGGIGYYYDKKTKNTTKKT
jgi:hypothetical protein